MAKIISILTLLFCLVENSFAATNNIACTYAALTNACANAADGDTIVVAAGSLTINTEIDIDRNVSFRITGAGTNSTTFISGSLPQAIWFFSNSGLPVTIDNINCIGNAINSGGFLLCGWHNRSNPGPYHIYNVQMTNVLNRGISMGFGGSFGLIDHCYFKSAGGGYEAIDFQGELTNWVAASPFGTTNVVCVEDCSFDSIAGGGNGHFDAYSGAQILFRHNFLNGYAPSGGHGYDSQTPSIRTWEVYNNTWSNATSGLLLQWRGGSGVNISNTVIGSGATLARLDYYRSSPSNHVYSPYLPYGKPGFAWTVKFDNITDYPYGCGWTYNGNPTNGQSLTLGTSIYFFSSSYVNNEDFQGLGGGTVVIGSDVAHTMTNLFNCVNLGPGAGTTYAAAAVFGHDFLAASVTTTSIILTNALDSNTNIFGYPAYNQPGELNARPFTTVNINQQQPTMFCCYFASNTVNGILQTTTVGDNDAQSGYYITNLVQEGRNYTNGVLPTAGVWTPLIYPHPLQATESGGGSGGGSTNPVIQTAMRGTNVVFIFGH